MGEARQEAQGSVHVFVGYHDRQLDDKGRVALPSSYRPDLGDKCYVSLGGEGCVTLRTVKEFETHAQDLIDAEKRGEMSRARRRAMSVTSSLVSIDKQGRFTLEERFRHHAGLVPGAPVVVAGTFDAIEIWKPERFTAVEAEGLDEEPGRQWDD
jgi:MraZ protein